MESFKQLIYLLIYFYLGLFTDILYVLLLYSQRRLKFIKILAFFSFILFLWINISYKYNITFNFLFLIMYILGIIANEIVFKDELIKANKVLVFILSKIGYFLKIIGIPPIYYKIKCMIHTNIQYKKYPYIKPKNEYYLF